MSLFFNPKAVAMACCFIFVYTLGKSQSLNLGDVVIVGYNFKDPDEFSLLTLVDLYAGTQLYITDSGWDANSMSFRKGEGLVTYTVPTGGILAGTQILYPHDPGFTTQGVSGFFGLALAGDQLFVFQGSFSNPSFIFGLSDYDGSWQATSVILTNQTSHLPIALQTTTLVLNQYVLAHFNCITPFIDKQSFLVQVLDPFNWVKEPSRTLLPLMDCKFEILPIQDEQWSYEWRGSNRIELKFQTTPKEDITWLMLQNHEMQDLNCFASSQVFSCVLPTEMTCDFLLKPCSKGGLEETSGMYKSITLHVQEELYVTAGSTMGSISVVWGNERLSFDCLLYDLLGNSVFHKADCYSNESIDGLKSGLYILQVRREGAIVQLKVVVL